MSDCPTNAFMLAGSEPAWIADVLVPVRELLVVGIFLVIPVALVALLVVVLVAALV